MNNIYRLKIYLKGRPKIWRRFLVEDNITFNKLHEIIQDVMGWQNYHLYEFEFNRSRISIPDEDSGLEASDSRKLKIKNLKINQKFKYIYDFGDSWEHIIAVEKIMPKEDNVFYPRCIEGELSCPPEDCGGIYRYSHLLSVKKNRKHPEYKELIEEWLGKDFDPKIFDVNEVNKKLLKHMGHYFKKSNK